MKKQLQQLGVLLIIIVTFSSCLNLKHVNDFSTASSESIKSFETLNYSFKQSCIDKCISKNINALKINSNECNCALEKVADSITLKIYASINGYFKGLSKLSDNELTAYKTEDLETALIEGDFGPIKIEEKHVRSYSQVAKVLMRAFTDTYRKNKIKEYIKDANAPIKELITFLDFNLSSNLSGKLNVKKDRVKSDYFDLLNDNSLSTIEKRNSLREYYAKLDEIKNQQEKIASYSKSLTKVAEGHQKLFDDVNKLTSKEIKQALFQYASEVKLLISEFKKIKE
ncbi:hypothetical protein [Tenacibaculum agarivorans]|uniref:hypothetical protein n=1 Tax=Tenacibaculum agarivorans TaxID=1908389 RepID=UPI00094BADE5|nr:hypothetical protein [Tenacibaculum agarivorans]